MARDPAITPAQLLSARAQMRVAQALTLMREGQSATRAAKKAGTTLRTMQRHGGKALKQTPSRRYEVAVGDRLLRRVRFLTPVGLVAVDAPTSRTASRIARYWAAVNHYLRTGDDRRLRPFRGKAARIHGRPQPFVTDLRTLERLAHAGEVRFEDLYESQA